MTPADAIAMLDGQLAAHGESVTLRRRIGTGGTFVSIGMLARLQRAGDDQVVDIARSAVRTFVLSPTPLNAADPGVWPGAAGGDVWPKANDEILIGGRPARILDCEARRFGDVVVRIEGRAQLSQ